MKPFIYVWDTETYSKFENYNAAYHIVKLTDIETRSLIRKLSNALFDLKTLEEKTVLKHYIVLKI